MKLVTKNKLKRQLGGAIIAGILTAIFMYVVIYSGSTSIYSGLCMGFFIYIGSSFYSDYIERRFLRKTNLILVLLMNVIIKVLIIFIVAWIFVWLFYLKADLSLVVMNFSFLFRSYFIIGIIFGLLLSFIFNFYAMVSTLVGPQVLGKLLIGMYHRPTETKRVFMFLDITSSTTIAEKIGHLKFLSLVNDFFFDIAEPIQKTKGEIYKYVGDEVIVTWKLKNAMINANCVNCFFMIDQLLEDRKEYYLKKYGLVPGFKAGMHGGVAVTGQLGYIKREIAYMGDVLNTSARIEEACKTFNKRFLVSEDLIAQIEVPQGIQKTEVGKVLLRGKVNEMKLFSLEKG